MLVLTKTILFVLPLVSSNTTILAKRDVHGSGWVKLRMFFTPTHHGRVEKNSTPPNLSQGSNLTQPKWIGLAHWLDICKKKIKKKICKHKNNKFIRLPTQIATELLIKPEHSTKLIKTIRLVHQTNTNKKLIYNLINMLVVHQTKRLNNKII